MKSDSRTSAAGFTLLEVLVALAIVGLGMIAVFTQLNQSLQATRILRDKTLAHWVALDQIAELRVSGQFPEVSERTDEVDMATTVWRYRVSVSQTPVESLRRVDVEVSFPDAADNILAKVTGFIGRPPASSALPTTGWTALDPDAQPTSGETE